MDGNATGPVHDGSDWCSALVTVEAALATAVAGDTILVADGLYSPDPTGLVDPREATFELVDGVTIAGGYAGCGAANPDEHDLIAYETVLSGDLNGDDGPEVANTGENCYHVVTGRGLNQATVLDGLTITAGNADGTYEHGSGGGLFIQNALMILRDVHFLSNQANSWGGAAKVRDGDVAFTGCSFIGNRGISGGAVGADSEVDFVDCLFRQNSAVHGGAIRVDAYGQWVLTNCTFEENVADEAGGAICLYGGASELIAIGCVFAVNVAGESGGAVYCDGWNPQVLMYSRFSENLATEYGGAIYANTDLWVSACEFQGNAAKYGGAIYSDYGGATLLEMCRLEGNAACQGGAAYLDGGGGAIDRCIIQFNQVIPLDPLGQRIKDDDGRRQAGQECRVARGGGVRADWGTLAVTNSLFLGNTAAGVGLGGGLYLGNMSSSSFVANCTFVGNSLEEWHAPGSTGAKGAGIHGAVDVRSCILWANHVGDQYDQEAQISYVGPNVAYNCIQGFAGDGGGFSNIGADPLFVDLDGGDGVVGTEDDNLRLQYDSPCINIGDPATVAGPMVRDLDGGPRLAGCRVDCGAYETPMGQRRFDFDDDEDVDLADFGSFQRCFGAAMANVDWLDACLCVFGDEEGEDIDLHDYASFRGRLDGP